MKEVSELIIYKQFIELIYYTEMITEKYPKIEKLAIVTNIKNTTYEGLKDVLKAYRYYDKLKVLNELDIKLKFLKVLIRISVRRKYINRKNYAAWSKKINNIGNLLGGWISSFQKL